MQKEKRGKNGKTFKCPDNVATIKPIFAFCYYYHFGAGEAGLVSVGCWLLSVGQGWPNGINGEHKSEFLIQKTKRQGTLKCQFFVAVVYICDMAGQRGGKYWLNHTINAQQGAINMAKSRWNLGRLRELPGAADAASRWTLELGGRQRVQRIGQKTKPDIPSECQGSKASSQNNT